MEQNKLFEENITTINNKEEITSCSNQMSETPQDDVQETEMIQSMDDFKDEIANSFHKYKEDDIVTGTVIGISDTEVIVDLGSYAEGIIKLAELSNDPRFSIKADISVGDKVTASVIREDREGHILLSKKQAEDILSWDTLKTMQANRTIATIKVAQTVKSGVVTYLNGIRAFLPASQLGLEYVEDLESYVGKELEVIVITVEEESKKLVLSAKEVAKDKAAADKTSRVSKLQAGLVTTGKVEKIMPFGAFVNIGDGLSGLVHISQICGKRIKSPSEVLKEGQEVTVKIIGVTDGKVSLSIKAVEEKEEVVEHAAHAPLEFSTGEEATTGLASLLKGLKLL